MNITKVTSPAALRIAKIDRKVSDLLAKKEDEIATMRLEYQWMDNPLVELDAFRVDGEIEGVKQMHLLDTIWLKSGAGSTGSDYRAHDAENCPANSFYCQKVGATRRTRGSRDIGFEFVGVFDLVARTDSRLLLVGASPTE